MQLEHPAREIIYVGDPMCSWCWGIAPELDELKRRRPDLPLRVIVGGLRPGPSAEVVTERMAETLAHHWRQVTARSGQPFDHAILARGGWTYDTEPACKAVVVMREIDEAQAWPLFKRLQRAFYAEGIEVWDPATLPPLVAEFDVDVDGFMEAFHTPDATKATWRDFATARNWGISGFPTVIARDGDRGHVIAEGYTPADDMHLAVDRLVGPAPAPFCVPGEIC